MTLLFVVVCNVVHNLWLTFFLFECHVEQVFVAMLVDNFLYPISALRSHFTQSINWSGIIYYLKDGKIYKIYLFFFDR